MRAVQRWYRARLVRRVFLITLILTVLLLLISRVETSGFSEISAIVCAIICIAASIMDTWTSLQIFKRTVKEVEQNHVIRHISIYGDERVPQCYTPEELKAIKSKKLSYTGTILLKAVFILLLVSVLFM